MKKLLTLIGLVITSLLSAQHKMEFSLDYNCFSKSGSDKQIVELYFSVPVKNLKYNESLKASYLVSAKVFDGDKLVANDLFGQYSFLRTAADINSTSEIPSQSVLQLKPGTYRLKTVITDLASQDSSVIDVPQSSGKFVVRPVDSKMNISGIQLGSKIHLDGNIETQFYKKGIVVVPNPKKTYGTHNPSISYYAELYNLEKTKNYRLNWEIYSQDNKFISKGNNPINLTDSSITQAVFDSVNITDLKSGNYNFLLRLTDFDGKESVTRSNNFMVYRTEDYANKNYTIESLVALFKTLSSEQIDEELKKLANRLNENEQKLTLSLSNNEKRNFLNEYWSKKMTDNPVAYNEFCYFVQLANQEYGTVSTEGWKTDRGKTIIKMGKPDKKDQLVMNRETVDHEIWSYYKDNVKFVFADPHNIGYYKLIYSDYPGKNNDPNWESKLNRRNFGLNSTNE